MTFLRLKERIGNKLKPVRIPARAPFPVDDSLVARQLEAAKSCPVNGIKPVVRQP